MTESKLAVRKNILFGGYESNYVLTSDSFKGEPSKAAAHFAALLLNKIVGNDALSKGFVNDIKGRDRGNAISEAALNSTPEGEDELMWLSGTIIVTETIDAPEDSDGELAEAPLREKEVSRPQKFSISITTKFDEFLGAHHIRHALEQKITGDFQEPKSVAGILADHSLQLNEVRFGLDLFKSSFFSMLGFAPVVYETLLIEVHGTQLQLRINAEKLTSRTSLPLTQLDILPKLSEVLNEVLGFDLTADYRSKLAE